MQLINTQTHDVHMTYRRCCTHGTRSQLTAFVWISLGVNIACTSLGITLYPRAHVGGGLNVCRFEIPSLASNTMGLLAFCRVATTAKAEDPYSISEIVLPNFLYRIGTHSPPFRHTLRRVFPIPLPVSVSIFLYFPLPIYLSRSIRLSICSFSHIPTHHSKTHTPLTAISVMRP